MGLQIIYNIKKFIKFILIKLLEYTTRINLLYLVKIKKLDLFYPEDIGFGDYIGFYLKNYPIIKNKKIILVFSNIEKKIVKFFFSENNYIELLFKIPFLFHYDVLHKKIKYYKYFRPTKTKLYMPKDSIKKFLNIKLSKNMDMVSQKLLNIKNQKFIIFNIKNYNDNKNDFMGSPSRQTTDFEKVKKIIHFLEEQKIKILIMGYKSERAVKKIYNLKKNNIIKNNIFFFHELSSNFSIIDQIFISKYSIGYLGNASGPTLFPILLKKKLLVFDSNYDEVDNRIPKTSLYLLHKKYTSNSDSNIKLLDTNKINNLEINIIENSYEEIINAFKKHFNF